MYDLSITRSTSQPRVCECKLDWVSHQAGVVAAVIRINVPVSNEHGDLSAKTPRHIFTPSSHIYSEATRSECCDP